MLPRRAAGAGVVAAMCCAVIALAVTGGGSPSVLAPLSGCLSAGCRQFDLSGFASPATLGSQAGKQLSVVQLLAGEAVEPLHGQHQQTTTARKQGNRG
jgi:hypothetical protein